MKKGEHNGRTTERGFCDFAEIVDTYGNTVTVRESSAACVRAVWLFTRNADGSEDRVAEPHLDVRAARRLVAALNRFIEGAAPQKRKAVRRG